MYPNHIQPQMHSKARLVRLRWSEFERWEASRRTAMERRRDEITKEQDTKWRATPARSRTKKEDHETNKASLIRKLEEQHFSEAREEWQRKLQTANLMDEDWGPMTPAETRAVEIALGGDMDEEQVVVAKDMVTNTQTYLNIPETTPAPPLSSGTRTTNTSASSYMFVKPSDLRSDDELYEAVSSYMVPTDESEDERMPIPMPIHDSKGWGMDHNGWGSNYSSQTGSPDQLSSSKGQDYFSLSLSSIQSKEADPNLTLPKRPPDIDRKQPRRVPGPSYIGPKLDDPDETSDEEADFEKFKMQTRITKILEFHHAAAQADIDLAITIQNDRRDKNAGKANNARKVLEHEKQMLRLQATKEEERKAIVALERGKRRDEIRKRSATRESARAADNAVHHSWDGLLDSKSIRLDIVDGKVVLGQPADEIENQKHGLDTSSFDTSRMPEAPRGRKQSISVDTPPNAPVKQSGWRTMSSPAQPQWPTTNSAASAAKRGVEETSRSSDYLHPLAQSISFDDHDFQLPGGFPSETKTTPLANGWARKAGHPPEKPTKVSPPPTVPTASIPAEANSSTSSAPSKKQNKKQRQTTKKSVDATEALYPTEMEAETPSTPRPTLPHMTKSTIFDDVTSTPRPSALRHILEPSTLADSATEDTPWARMARKKAEAQLDPSANAPFAIEEEESPWARMMRKKVQIVEPKQEEVNWTQGAKQKLAIPGSYKPIPTTSASTEESLWDRVTKQKSQLPETRNATASKPMPFGSAEEESPWAQMMKKNQLPSAKPSGAFNSYTMAAEEEMSPWDRMIKNKASTSATLVTPPEETPWERAMRVKAQASSAISAKANTDQMNYSSAPKQGQRWNDPDIWTPSMNQSLDSSPPLSSAVPPQAHPNEKYRMNGSTGSVNPHGMWNPMARARSPQRDKSNNISSQHGPATVEFREAEMHNAFAPSSILKNSKMKKTVKGKKVVMEEVSDEEGPDGRKPPDAKLPSNSRSILDIVEPKPSVPPTMFTSIFQYGEDYDDGNETGSSSMIPTPSTAPTSPPGEIPSMDDDWLLSATEDIKNGDWGKLLGAGTLESATKAKHTAWTQDFHANEKPVAHTFDSTKLASALESFGDAPSTTKKISPPAALSSKRTTSPIRPAVVEKVEKAETAEKVEKVEKKETPAKPVKETKTKAKAKGKGGKK